jgi:hypothetical protein
MANAAENAFADRAILLDENLLLFEQNNKKITRNSIKATVVGSARVLSYKDIVEAQKKRDEKEEGAEAVRGRRRSKQHKSTFTQVKSNLTADHFLEPPRQCLQQRRIPPYPAEEPKPQILMIEICPKLH